MRISLKVAAVAVSFVLTGCFAGRDDNWDVIALGLPSEISPRFSHSLSTAYVLKQTHEPLFRHDDRKGYFSNVLDNWKRSIDSTEFSLCVGRPKPFGDGSAFDSAKLREFLATNLRRLQFSNYVIIAKDDCEIVRFNQSQRRFLYEFSLPENAPSQTSRLPKIENGLGAYFVDQALSDKLILKRKVTSKNGYNSITFTNVDQLDAAQIEKMGAEDHNLLPVFKIPQKIKTTYKSYQTMPLKIGALVLNIKDPEVRRAVADCVDIRKLRETLFTNGTQFSDISSILPVGVPGARSGLLPRRCSESKKQAKALRFATWMGAHQDELKKDLSGLGRQVGVEVKPEYYSYSDLTKLIYYKKDQYDLLVIKIDTKSKATSPFFEVFVDAKKSILRKPLTQFNGDLQALRAAEGDGLVSAAAERLQKSLIDGKYVLPLFQETRALYYPKALKNIYLDDDYLDFPNLSRVERAGI